MVTNDLSGNHKRRDTAMKRTIQKLPIEIENFEKLRQDEFYYIDKTGLIRRLFKTGRR